MMVLSRVRQAVVGQGPRLSRLLLGAFVGLAVSGGVAPAARAQDAACDRVRLVDSISNIDLVVRCPSGELRHIRVAGLAVWPEGWPLADPDLNRVTLSDRISDLVGANPLILGAPLGNVRFANGVVSLYDPQLSDGRGSLAEWMVRQGWAQVQSETVGGPAAAQEIGAALRPLQGEARDARRGIWEVLEPMITYTTPDGGHLQVDRRLTSALDLLAGMDTGRGLLNTLARAGVPVFMAAERPEIEAWAHYDDIGRAIWVHTSLIGADPRTTAVVLAHEATHAQDHYEGRFSSGRILTPAQSQACYDTEIRAFSNELAIWRQLFGDEGKSPEVHRIEREANVLLGQYGTSAEELDIPVRRAYRAQCRIRA